MIPVEKNKTYSVTIEAISSEGNGIAHIDGYTIFVPQTAVGDVCRVLVVKVKSSYAYAKLKELLTPSPVRTEPVCPAFSKCGGCVFQHLTYEEQLRIKKQTIEDALIRIGNLQNAHVEEILGMEHPLRYRNKMVFPIGGSVENPVCGFYRERSHDIIPLSDCALGDAMNQDIIKTVLSFMKEFRIAPYQEETHSGCVRRIFTRRAYHTGEWMVVLSVNANALPHAEEFVKRICAISGDIVSIYLNCNQQKNNLVLGGKNVLLFGKPVISDLLCALSYEISPDSFFQVNPQQTEKLYQKAIEFAGITKDDTVLDVYCGIGTISLCAAQKAKNVIGVEIVPQAIENAKENAKRNQIANATFYAAAAEDLVPKLIADGIRPDVVILDPPRKGCDENTLNAILTAQPKRIVYVSCNPATLARDLKLLCTSDYQLKQVVGVDMFPFTHHVEAISLLVRNKKRKL